MSHVRITVDVKMTIEQMASLFCAMMNDEQAAFFNEVGRIASSWPSGGWCVQACRIAPHLNGDGAHVVSKLVEHRELL